MDDSFAYRPAGAVARDRTHTLYAQTIGYVAGTAGLFALGAYAGRNLAGVVGILAFIAAFGCLIGMQFAARRSVQLTVVLLAAFGVLMGLALAPTLATTRPSIRRRSGRRAGRRRCSSRRSARPATPPAAT